LVWFICLFVCLFFSSFFLSVNSPGDICSIELREKEKESESVEKDANENEETEVNSNSTNANCFESIIRVLDRVGSVVTLPNGLAYCPNRLESV
jgi:hypothetical protein